MNKTEYLEVQHFCIKDRGDVDNFIKDDGYIILLRISDVINDYANQVNAISRVINLLESWKSEEFYNNKLTYEIDWFNCYRCDKSIKKVTLAKAKTLYKETKVKYDTLYNLFKETSEIHYEGDELALINKYFSNKRF